MYSLWLLHLDIETLTFFEFFLVPEALLFCCVVAKLKNCRVASSYNRLSFYAEILIILAECARIKVFLYKEFGSQLAGIPYALMHAVQMS